MVILVIGGLTLESFEIPARLRFGGKQALAIHRLPGGVRVIDAMGRDDSELTWSGVLSGPAAGNRARALDALRVAGNQLALSWDEFYYTTIIARLELTYTNPWWIGYDIACTVVRDEAQSPQIRQVTPAASVLADVTAAAGAIDISGVLSALSLPGSSTLGTTSHAASVVSLAAAQASLTLSLATAETGLTGADLASTVAAAGSLANLTRSQGFLGRAATNLNLVGG